MLWPLKPKNWPDPRITCGRRAMIYVALILVRLGIRCQPGLFVMAKERRVVRNDKAQGLFDVPPYTIGKIVKMLDGNRANVVWSDGSWGTYRMDCLVLSAEDQAETDRQTPISGGWI